MLKHTETESWRSVSRKEFYAMAGDSLTHKYEGGDYPIVWRNAQGEAVAMAGIGGLGWVFVSPVLEAVQA